MRGVNRIGCNVVHRTTTVGMIDERLNRTDVAIKPRKILNK
jgi:hypothetical protein